MSDILSEEFFSDADVPVCIKIGVIGLALGGTYDPNAKNANGDRVFVSKVYKKGSKPTPIIHEYNRNCLKQPFANGLLKSLGLNDYFGENLDVIFDGSHTDKQICDTLADAGKSYYNMSTSGVVGSYENSRAAIVDTLKIAVETNHSVVKSSSVDRLMDVLDSSFGKNKEIDDKKKQITTQTM